MLILSCNTGEGHNSCAAAIKNYYNSMNEECDIKDALGFIGPRVSRMFSKGHVTVYRYFAGAYRKAYGYYEKHPVRLMKRTGLYRLLYRGVGRLYKDIVRERYDAVICAHSFAAVMMEKLQALYKPDISIYFVATDYMCSPGIRGIKFEGCFIPNADVAEEFRWPCADDGQIVDSGIPVREMFYEDTDRDAAKAAFDVPADHRHLVLMCGSMGAGPMMELAGKLADRLPDDVTLTIVCGTNVKLKEKLDATHGSIGNIHIRGFVKDMSLLLDSADLYLTKPGGISITEATLKSVPMVLVDAVAGCEGPNLEFFVSRNCARTGKNTTELADICMATITDNEVIENMRQNFIPLRRRNAAKTIYGYIKEKYGEQ